MTFFARKIPNGLIQNMNTIKLILMNLQILFRFLAHSTVFVHVLSFVCSIFEHSCLLFLTLT